MNSPISPFVAVYLAALVVLYALIPYALWSAERAGNRRVDAMLRRAWARVDAQRETHTAKEPRDSD